MSLTILYHNPARPDDDGMTMISGQAEAAAVLDQLATRGFVIDKITLGPVRARAAAIDRP
jgi:hypothetical protein